MAKKQVKKTKQVRKIDPSTGDWTFVTETYFETVSDSGSSCGGANDWGSSDSGGGSCGE